MKQVRDDEIETAESEIAEEGGIYVLHKSMKVDGNLDATQQISAYGFKVMDGSTNLPVMSVDGEDENGKISFKRTCEFLSPVQFNDGLTLIGYETTNNTAYIGSPTIQAGNLLTVGDSLFKVAADERRIVADTFKMLLSTLVADKVSSTKETADLVEAKNVTVSEQLTGKTIVADTIKTNDLVIENVSGNTMKFSDSISVKDLVVSGAAKIGQSITINGSGTAGSALIVNGGEIVANKGIVSHTRNNMFQTLEIMGSGTANDVCFNIDKNVDSLIQGNVTIQDSSLILDGSKLYTDDIVVTSLNEVNSESANGIRITTNSNWDTYEDSMLDEVEVSTALEETYDPYAQVQEAIARNASNYQSVEKTVKSIVNPITYADEQNSSSSIPVKFAVKSGICRIDSNGNAMLRNVVSEQGKFSSLSAFDLKVNQFQVDKLVTTSVASNVVDTDNLLKSRGIAEFDGVVNTGADIFVEKGSSINMADETSMTFQNGSSLVLKNGASFEMGSSTSVKMSGDIELDLAKLVFSDSTTGNRYRIGFTSGSDGLVMTYEKVEDDDSDTAETTSRSASELSRKMSSLGL